MLIPVNRLPGKHRIESVPQIKFGYDGAALIKVFIPVVDPPEVEHVSGTRNHGHFRRRRRPGQPNESLLRVQQDGK